MTDDEARRVLLIRAFEDPLAAPWTESDRLAVDQEAARRVGEQASAERLLVERATLATQRLAQRDPAVRAALAAATWPAATAPVLLLLVFAAGLAVDGVGSGARINLFAPPLLLMLAWNLGMYLLLGIAALRGPGHHAVLRPLLARAVARVGMRPARRLNGLPGRFVADWLLASSPLQVARAAALMHAAAAVLAIGMLGSMYARGSFFEFRAGWDSTFFDASALHGAMSMLFGPAARLAGIVLPNVDEFAALRFSAGSGEVAARWIHLIAINVALLVVLPRAVLSALAASRAQRIAQRFPLALSEAYFKRLLGESAGAETSIGVLPYGYRLAPELNEGLKRVLVETLASGVALEIADSVPPGDEEAIAHRLADTGGHGIWVALFPLTATPERETHGAFLHTLAAQLPPATRLMVLVDESGFRQRFAGPEWDIRLEQRRGAWRQFLGTRGYSGVFADLAQSPRAR